MRMKKNLILFISAAGWGDVRLSAGSGHPEHPVAYLAFLRADCGISVDNPMILDLAVIQLAFGFELGINIAQIICVLICHICL